jgi:hypothetical protein
MWSVDHIFAGKPKACQQAHSMVLKQCEVCSQCKVEHTECEASAPPDTQEIFDCTSGAAVEWSDAKKAWCCENHQQACDLMPRDNRKVFFQRKVVGEDSVLSRMVPRSVISGICISLVMFAAVFGLAIRSVPTRLVGYSSNLVVPE